MGWAAFIDQMLVNVCGLLLSVLMLKQIIMNLYDLISPVGCCGNKQEKKRLAFERRVRAHYNNNLYKNDYREMSSDKENHMNAEKQTAMAK